MLGLEPRVSWNKASLAQWQKELRLLIEALLEQSMKQSGPILSDGVTKTSWTLVHPL